MGMLIDGVWHDETDRFMHNGTFHREQSTLVTASSEDIINIMLGDPARVILVASASCPWSHAAVIARVLKRAANQSRLQIAGGARIEGYALMPNGPLFGSGRFRHIHQLYCQTDPDFTGRATVPVLWDAVQNRILSDSSAKIIGVFDRVGGLPTLFPEAISADIDALNDRIFEGLSNAVYRAGLAQKQDEYDTAVETVFDTMQMLEERLAKQPFLFGTELTAADIRLFATLVRFDTVYATHFRCTRKRLVDHAALWRFTRRIYQMPGICETVDFDEIRFGYYVNDGSHNPFAIVAQQPVIDWQDRAGF